VNLIDTAQYQELVQEMLNICRGRGVGLAAPQIGVPYRIFVMEDTEEGMSDVEEAVRTPSPSRNTPICSCSKYEYFLIRMSILR
jgi:peptide deformylase